ncbi:caspase recruitment domain-containing protein 10 isoform X1 [Tachysurus vachellii]|uniref:caspase recruitment domain-containing protein 10 isoform X1 n=1 Tax=Tachysurus vachellii TaxID=175792 RepID=UPI00296B0EA8|nr:caspase recruitment domain-containing protein 10 isoform X1 [Tachysurus vachellii]
MCVHVCVCVCENSAVPHRSVFSLPAWTMSGGNEWAGQCDVPPEESPWSEEACEEMWERVEGVRHKLTRILNPAKVTPYLRQCKVIDEQDEDEVLNSTQLPLRISKAGRLLDILRGRGQRGLQAFMESLEFYHPEQYTQLTGQQATQRCSMMLDEEGHEGLTQFLLLEVRKLREQLRNSRMCERHLSQRCHVAEDERSRAEKRYQELREEHSQLERLRQDCEAGVREMGRLKERLLEQAVKYSRVLEEQRNASTRERELLSQIEQLKKSTDRGSAHSSSITRKSGVSVSVCGAPAGQEVVLQHTDSLTERISDTQALLDILHQDRREAAEQRKELCGTIIRLQGELESAEAIRGKLEAQCEQLQLRLQTLQLDWEEEQKRSLSYFNQIMELERERDQALCSRDSLQLEFTDCLLDKNRLRKCITELQERVEQLHRELEREKGKNHEHTHTQSCSHGSHLSLLSEECFGPCCSLSLTSYNSTQLLNKSPSNGQNSEHSEDSHHSSEENLHSPLNRAKEINRLSTFPFPPHINSISRRVNTEFDLDSWGSDETENITGSDLADTESSLWDSCSSLQSYFVPLDPSNLLPNAQQTLKSEPSPSSPPSSTSLADDITVVGGNRTGIFVQTVRVGSAAERCGLREGSELIELEEVMFSGGGVDLTQCTSEVAHFTLQCWTEPSSLKHRVNEEGYSHLNSELSSPSFTGADSFYVRVNLDLFLQGEQPCLRVTCDDILHVTDTRYNGKYQWRCTRVDIQSAKPLQNGAVPNYNRAQQLLLVKLRTITLQQQDKKKKFRKKVSERVRLVKTISPKCRGSGSSSSVLYTLSNRHEEHLIPYSMVQPVKVECKRPVIFSPSVLSHGLIERLLQPADSGLLFNTCPLEPIPVSERNDKGVFLLDHTHTDDHTLGIRLQSIQEVVKQDKHCLLQLNVSSVEALLKQGVYPIIIHIKPKDKKGRKFRKLLSCIGDSDVMEVVRVEELHLETLPLMFSTLQPSDWSCTDELIHTVRHTIHKQQGALVWLEMDRIDL